MSVREAEASGIDTFVARFDSCIGQLRSVAQQSGPAQRIKLTELADELARLRRDLTGLEMAVVPERRPEFAHGTLAGYCRHLRAGETACVACKSAHAEYQRGNKKPQIGRGQANANRYSAKNRDGKRYCQKHDDGAGAWLAPEDFDLKDKATGKRKAWCRKCTLRYQRERYAKVGTKVIAVELLEGDGCLGQKCLVCAKPFHVGDVVAGTDLRHDKCRAP